MLPAQIRLKGKLAVSKKYVGYIVISDEVKEDSARAIQGLRQAGVNRLVMLTGDNREVGEAVGRTLELVEVHAELLPDQKVMSMVVKGIFLTLGAGGLATMWEAVFADVGVALVAIINATRVIRYKVTQLLAAFSGSCYRYSYNTTWVSRRQAKKKTFVSDTAL